MDTTLSPESIALLNRLTDKQKDYALTIYAGREKKNPPPISCGFFSAFIISTWAIR